MPKKNSEIADTEQIGLWLSLFLPHLQTILVGLKMPLIFCATLKKSHWFHLCYLEGLVNCRSHPFFRLIFLILGSSNVRLCLQTFEHYHILAISGYSHLRSRSFHGFVGYIWRDDYEHICFWWNTDRLPYLLQWCQIIGKHFGMLQD